MRRLEALLRRYRPPGPDEYLAGIAGVGGVSRGASLKQPWQLAEDVPSGLVVPDRPRLHSLLEGRVRTGSLIIGGRDKNLLVDELRKNGDIQTPFSIAARNLVDGPNFTTLPEAENVDTVFVNVGTLVGSRPATTSVIFEEAERLGLDKAHSETAIDYVLVKPELLEGESVTMGMEPMADNEGLKMFRVVNSNGGFAIGATLADPDRRWNYDTIFLFLARKQVII